MSFRLIMIINTLCNIIKCMLWANIKTAEPKKNNF